MNVREQRKANQKFDINFVSHEFFSRIKTGYKQTDGGGVNTQYKSNKKQKMGTYAVNIYRWLICKLTVRNEQKKVKRTCNTYSRSFAYCKVYMCFLIALTLYNRTNHVNVKYHKSPVWNCHSEDKHSIIIGILIPSTTKYINMCSISFIVPFYLII